MGDNNTIGLLTNINNSLGKIVEMMMPQNGDPQKQQANAVKNLSQGGLGSGTGGSAPTAEPAGGAVNGIDVAKIASALDGLPESVKAIAKLSGRTVRNFTSVLTSIIKVFTSKDFKELDQKNTDSSANLIKAITELGKLPDALKDASKIKEKDIEKFCKLVTKILETISSSLQKSKVTKDDVETAKKASETILALTTAVKSLAKMTLIAPLAMIGLIAITPVWIAFGLVLSLIGLLEKPMQAGIRALRGVDKFMHKMMKTALLGLAVAGGILLLGMFMKNNVKTMLLGLAGLTAVFLAVGVIAILGGLVGLLIKSTNFFDKQIIKFTLELMLIAGLTIVLGMLLEVGWKQALLGLGGMVVVMLAMLGIAVLINIVGTVSMESIKSMAGVLLLMVVSMGIAATSVLLGQYLKENWDAALVGFAAMNIILGEVIGIAYLAKRVGKEARSGIINLLLAEGVILASMAIVWAVVKTGELVWDFFGTDTLTALAKVGIVFAISTAIIYGALGVSKIANRAKRDIQKGALSLLMAEGVILAAAVVTAAVIKVSDLVKETNPDNIMITMTVMAGVVGAAGVVAAVASKFQSTIKKGALVMAILELLILGMVGVVYAIVKVAQSVEQLQNRWEDVLITVGAMAGLLLAFTGVAAAFALLANPYSLTALAIGGAILLTIELLIFGMVAAVGSVVKLSAAMEESGKTPEEMGEFLKTVSKKIFTYENLNPGVSGLQALKLAGKFMALMPVFLGMGMMINVVSRMAKQFGGMVEVTNAKGDGTGMYGIRPYYGMNGETPIYGEPVYLPEIATQIVESVRVFAESLQTGFENIDVVRIAEVGLTLGLIVDPVSKFAQMLTGITNGGEEGTLRPVFFNDGEIRYGTDVKIVEVAGTIARSISTFASTLFGDGENLPQWMMFTRYEKGRNRIENAMKTLALIVEPVDTFTQLLTSYQSAGYGKLRKITFDANGNIDDKAPVVDIIDVASTISSAIGIFGSKIFGDDADWMKTFKKVDDSGDNQGTRAMNTLAKVISPVSSFVDALLALAPEGSKLYAVTVDEHGNIRKREVDVVNTATQIAKAVSVFVSTLFAEKNVDAWRNMMKATKDSTANQIFADGESSGGAVGVLSVVIDPITNFAKALMAIGGESGENGELLIPVYDRDGKLVEKRAIDLVAIATAISNAVTTFVSTLFSAANQKMWLSLIYGYDEKGNVGTTQTNLKDSIGVFAAVIDPVVKFMEVITMFGGTPDKFQIYDGDKPRTINLIEVSNAIALAITTFMEGMNPAFEKIKDFDAGKKQMIGDFAATVGNILENFAKIGETKREQIDLASVVIDKYFNTIDTVTEKLKGDFPEKQRLIDLDDVIQQVKTMFSTFSDINFKELNYKEGFDAVLDVFTRTRKISDQAAKIQEKFSFGLVAEFTEASKTLNAYFAAAPMPKKDVVAENCDTMYIIAMGFSNIPVIPENDETKNRLWFIEPFVKATVSLKQMLITDSAYAQNASLSIDLITKMGNSMLDLSAVPAKELDDISKAYYNLLSRVIKLSDKRNTRSIVAMNDALKDSTVQIASFDQRLVKHADERKKKLDELIEAVNDLNNKLETTSTRMGKIADNLTTISKLDSEKLKENANAINLTRGGSSSGGTGGGGGANGGENSGGAYIDMGSSLTKDDITLAIQRALDVFKLDLNDVTIAPTPGDPTSNSYRITGSIYADNDTDTNDSGEVHRYDAWYKKP